MLLRTAAKSIITRMVRRDAVHKDCKNVNDA
jgi:hypothetical protein